MAEIIFDVLRDTVLITGLVLIMMLMIEYFNIQSHGKWFSKLHNSKFNQVFLGSLLGLIPGCIGGFAAVSLFTHKMISFGALVAMMISSSGDESFVMLATMPGRALFLFAILFVISIIVGLVCDKFIFKKEQFNFCSEQYEIHEHQDDSIPSPFKIDSYKATLKKPSKERIILMIGIAIFIMAIIAGFLGEHEEIVQEKHVSTFTLNLLDERWMNVTFAIISVITILFTATAKEHFVKEHLWKHVIKKHLLSIFLWTFGGLLVCQIGIQYLDVEHWIGGGNMIYVILLAVAIGIIPESGPHLVFVTLFLNGLVPFSVLLANSIVQDGHTALPLIASSKKSFLKAKAVNIVVGLAIGIGCWLMGW